MIINGNDIVINGTTVSSTDLVNVSSVTSDIQAQLNTKAPLENPVFTGAVTFPSGTTAQRPSSPTVGMIRFNTDLNYLEEYHGGQWKGLSNIFTAEGGTITTYSSNGVNYKVHTFISSGTFVVTSGSTQVEYLVIAGGGAGGHHHGGGGGAGGYRSSVVGELSGRNTPAESAMNVVTGSYPIVIGAGGVATSPGSNPYIAAPSGSNSSFGNIISVGGGGGGQTESSGANGGSGGGAWNWSSSYVGGSGTVGQGFDGSDNGASDEGGGGGGAGAVGGPAPSRNGGAGLYSSINGTSTPRAGGGGAAGYLATPGSGGVGGGGAGGRGPHGGGTNGTAGTTNTGGGGGGTGAYDSTPHS